MRGGERKGAQPRERIRTSTSTAGSRSLVGRMPCLEEGAKDAIFIPSRDGECIGNPLRASLWSSTVSHAWNLSTTLMDCALMCSSVAFTNRYLQSQVKNIVIAWLSAAALILHIFLSWLVISKLEMGIIGAAITLNIAWWIRAIGELLYVTCGGCPLTWTGFSRDAFSDLWPFVKLSAASGIMLCLESWYYRVLVLLTGNLPNPKIAVDSLSICMNINGWEMMIHLGFFAATGVRVANELGAGNARGAKFAVVVSVATSSAIGLISWILILAFRNEFALAFTDSSVIIDAVSRLAVLLAFTVLLNSVQPVLSGVAVGSGWQSFVAYINIGCYYVVGIPFGVLLGWAFHLGVLGIWAGMIGGTAVQTLVLAFLTYRCDWNREAANAIDRVKAWSSVGPPQIRSSQVTEDAVDDYCPEDQA